MYASFKVRRTYSVYERRNINSNMTGYDVARKILDENGLDDVKIERTPGKLSDHYDPSNKVVRLSESNHDKATIAAASVAAHEVGHALQHSEGYSFLKFRTALVPVANLGSSLSFITILGGAIMSSMNLIILGTIFMAFAVLFQIITLPVEFNASSRALDEIYSAGILDRREDAGARKVLNAAAMTYVAGALVALMELSRFIFIILADR